MGEEPVLKVIHPFFYDRAAKASINNKEHVIDSTHCGCYFCCESFWAHEVCDFVTRNELETALCPHCGVDAVIPDESGLPVLDIEYLSKQNNYWFHTYELSDEQKR